MKHSQKKEDKSEFANFWRMIEPKIKALPDISFVLVGKGSAAARGSNEAIGVQIYGKSEEANLAVKSILDNKLAEYNQPGRQVEMKTLIDKPVRNNETPITSADHKRLQSLIKDKDHIDSRINELSKKSLTYFGSGVEGMQMYFNLRNDLAAINVNIQGIVTEDNLRDFNLMSSIRHAHPDIFEGLHLAYRDTSMTDMHVDIFYLNKVMFQTLPEVKMSNCINRLSNNALIALVNGAVTENEKNGETKMIDYCQNVLSCRKVRYNIISNNGLTIYHATKPTLITQ